MSTTFAALKERFATTTEFVGDFAADLNIPVLTGPQCQGDVAIAPPTSLLPRQVTIRDLSVCVPVTNAGVEVIRGGAMNNAHTLRTTDTGVVWYPDVVDDEELAFGVLTVPSGAVCFLEHVEHGFNGIGVGTFVVGRQREQRDQIALVQD